GFVAQYFVEALEQGPATGQDDALVANVGGEFRSRIFERDANALDDRSDGLGQRFGDLALVDRNLFRNPVDEVAALDVDGLADAIDRRLGDTDFFLDPLRRRLADQQIVVAPDVGTDRFVHLVAANPDRRRVSKAAERQHRDFGRSAADIDDHRSDRLG